MKYAIAAWGVRLMHALASLFPKQNKITFLTRQGKKGSLDFRMLSERLRESALDARVVVYATDPEVKNKGGFLLSLPVAAYHVATSRVCVLEGYIPSVSVPRLDGRTRVIQLWHALGAIKKFGWQALDTDAGRSSEAAEKLSMHRNYDWVVAAGPGAVQAYAEAFDCEQSRIVALGMPRMDYLLDPSKESARRRKARGLMGSNACLMADGVPRILYAPTLRKGANAHGWLAREVSRLSLAFSAAPCRIIVAGHPLDGGSLGEEGPRSEANVFFVEGASSIDLLESCDVVVTDYSAVAFEAALAGKPVYFFVPDIDSYRLSPGLNIDPLIMFPEISSTDPAQLAERVLGPSRSSSFADFACAYFEEIDFGSTDRVAALVQECYLETFGNEKGD